MKIQAMSVIADRKLCRFCLSGQKVAKGLMVAVLLAVCLLLFSKCLTTTEERQKYFGPSTMCIGDIQEIERNISFAYSAYIDDRPTRDTLSTNGPVVRIFVYILRAAEVKDNWQCLFWYKDAVEPIRTPVDGITDLNEFAQQIFMPAMVLCILPENRNATPLSVSLAPKSTLFPNNFICITDLRRRRDGFVNEPRRTLDKDTTAKRFPTFTICTKAIHDDHYKINDIVNFIEVNRILGAEKFIFYTDSRINDHLIKHCLDSYKASGIVEIYPFTAPMLDSLPYHSQIITMTECMYRVMYRTEYVINNDFDEFVVPTKSNDWNEMLHSIHSNSSNADHIVSYSLQNQFFPLQEEEDPFFENNPIVSLHRITTLLQTLKEDHIFPHHLWSKMMVRPEKILIWHLNLIVKESLIDEKDLIYEVHPNDGLMYHYRQWPTSEKLIRDRRMHKFATRTIQNIHASLGHCINSISIHNI